VPNANANEPYYPPGAFYFSVTTMVPGKAPAGTEIDSGFQEVTGIQAGYDTETVVEGGENRFVWRLPKAVKYPNLVLKRGAVAKGSALGQWVIDTLGSGLAVPIAPKDLMVSLLDAAGNPLISWTFVRAWPLRWELASLTSTDNKVLIETLEMSYNYFTRLPSPA
jgi:phage tail-like protein